MLSKIEHSTFTHKAPDSNREMEVFSRIWSIYPVSRTVIDAPEDHSRKVDDDTVILSNVKSGSSAVYQCNASNEFGYLMANAFVNVLGELKCLAGNVYKVDRTFWIYRPVCVRGEIQRVLIYLML